MQQTTVNVQQTLNNKGRIDALTTKQSPRTPTILPQGAAIRPASSVSTQTAQNQALQNKAKMRNNQKPVRPAVANIKNDTQPKVLPTQGQSMQVVTSAGAK